MHEIDILAIDLNLLKIFDALYTDRNVTAVGQRLNMSQSTVSHALGRLREALGDPLFVRGARGVQPTERATLLAGPISQALAIVQTALDHHKPFAPETSTRTFRLLMTDMGEALFAPPLMVRLRQVAPHVRIIIDQRPREQYKMALESGQADLALGQLPQGQPDLFQQLLSHEPFFGFARTGHPILADPSLDRFFEAEHMIIGPPAVAEAHLAKALGSMAPRRRVALELRHYLSVGPILAATDLIAVIPQTVTQFLLQDGSLGRFIPPIAIDPVTMRQFWHARSHEEAGCKWLRSQIADLFLRKS